MIEFPPTFPVQTILVAEKYLLVLYLVPYPVLTVHDTEKSLRRQLENFTPFSVFSIFEAHAFIFT